MSVKFIKAADVGSVSGFTPLLLPATGHPPDPPAAAAETLAPPPESQAAMPEVDTSQMEAMRQAAQLEAQAAVAEAQARVEEIEREARERGLAAARATFSQELSAAVENLRWQFNQSLEELIHLRSVIVAQAEQELVRLALEIARKIVHREVRVDREVAVTLARVALSRLHSRAYAKVRLHPEDYRYLTAHRQRLRADSSVELVEDSAVSLGGCIVQTEMGDIDARIEQQFAEIERGFLEV
jgi:flagellar assembly protein FliH